MGLVRSLEMVRGVIAMARIGWEDWLPVGTEWIYSVRWLVCLWLAPSDRFSCPCGRAVVLHDTSVLQRSSAWPLGRCRHSSCPAFPMFGPDVVAIPLTEWERNGGNSNFLIFQRSFFPTLTLIRTIIFKCPWEYCSMTSRTSYGFLACWNLRRATKYLIFLIALMAFLCASVNLWEIVCLTNPL